MLQRGDPVPHFSVTTVHGQPARYSTIWQHRNLVLITLPAADSETARAYVTGLEQALPALAELDTACVITREMISGAPSPGAIVADRWGEVVYAAGGAEVADLPPVSELVEWAAWLQHRCPECEGEAK